MPHLVVTRKGSKAIEYLFKNGRRVDGTCYGDQSGPNKKGSPKEKLFNFYWTNDVINWQVTPSSGLVFNPPTIDSLNLIDAPTPIPKVTHNEVNRALKRLSSISRYEYSQVDKFVDNNETKVVLKLYGQVLLGLCKLVYSILSRRKA